MQYRTTPARALPIRMPRCQPGCARSLPSFTPSRDSESVTKRLSSASKKMPLGRLNLSARVLSAYPPLKISLFAERTP